MATTTLEASDLAELPRILEAQRCRRVLVLTGPSRRYVDRVLDLIGGLEHAVFAGARRHVPESVVAAAEEMFVALGADTLLALGGGSAIGLGKALRLRHDASFIAVPTTYAGSEQTTIYGTTRAGAKSTGRDPRVRPDAVIYDLHLTSDMPLALTATSLMNALAHPLGVLGSGGLDPDGRERALAAAELVFGALRRLLADPHDEHGRRAALRGAGLAAATLDSGKPGPHHALVHRLGGRFDVDHGGLHAVLLPHSLGRLRQDQPELVALVERRLGVSALETQLFDALAAAHAPSSLAALGIEPAAFADLLRADPSLPAALLEAAFHGVRPAPGAAP